MTANPYLTGNVDYYGLAGLSNFQSARYHRKNDLNRNLSLDINDIFNTDQPLQQRMSAIMARQNQHLRDMSDDEAHANDAFEQNWGAQRAPSQAMGVEQPSKPQQSPNGAAPEIIGSKTSDYWARAGAQPNSTIKYNGAAAGVPQDALDRQDNTPSFRAAPLGQRLLRPLYGTR